MKKKEDGFSLVEIIIVIAIMAILIGLLAPQYLKYVDKSRKAKDDHSADELLRVANVIASDEEYSKFVREDDYIRFDSNGITTNNTNIQTMALDKLIGNWQNVKVISNYYKGMYYEVKFNIASDDSRYAIQNGWLNQP